MPAEALLGAYHRRHDARDWTALARLFAPDGELVFHGLPVPRTRGPAAIERLFRERGPDDALVLFEGGPQVGGGFATAYAWRGRPEAVAGELLLVPDGERIGRLEIRALPGGPAIPRERWSIRAVVVAPGPKILLFRCSEPDRDEAWWWITPGGGQHPGEDDRATLDRELREEIGVGLPGPLGPCIWTRSHTFVWRDEAHRQHERFYLVDLPEGVELTPGGHRWWSLDELLHTDEVFAPRTLPMLATRLLRDGPPDAPLEVGV